MKLFTTYVITFLGSMFLSGFPVWAQSAIPVATNDNVTTTIFFPSNIIKVVPPAVNYKFEHDQGSNIGLLKGRNGKPSNLTVITEDGHIYSFSLHFSEDVQKFNFILTTDEAIGQTKPNLGNNAHKPPLKQKGPQKTVVSTNESSGKDDVDSVHGQGSEVNNTANQTPKSNHLKKPAEQAKIVQTTDTLSGQIEDMPQEPLEAENPQNEEDDLYNADRNEYYHIFCENNYLQKTIFKRSFRQHKKIALRLNNILVDRNEKYFVLQIENNSKKEYEVAGLSFFKKSDVGQLEKIMNPLYTFNLQERIDPESINEVVYVFENFTIKNKERIFIALADENSDNMVVLPLDDLLINSPSN